MIVKFCGKCNSRAEMIIFVVQQKQKTMYLDKFRDSLPPLCEKYHVKRLYAFGSVLTDRFGPDSDVDLIVDFVNWRVDGIADDFFDFRDELQTIFNRPVDLMGEQPIRNPILRRSIENTKRLIYERTN